MLSLLTLYVTFTRLENGAVLTDIILAKFKKTIHAFLLASYSVPSHTSVSEKNNHQPLSLVHFGFGLDDCRSCEFSQLTCCLTNRWQALTFDCTVKQGKFSWCSCLMQSLLCTCALLDGSLMNINRGTVQGVGINECHTMPYHPLRDP